MPNRRALPALLLALLPLVGCDPLGPAPPVDPTPDPPAVLPPSQDLGWLRANAVVLRTAVADGEHADLLPLRAAIGSARIVGLGEATHGTREFFTMKHRLLEFLVKELGFTTFGIEATYAESLAVNEWVHGGEGDPEVLLSNLYFWTWNTEEVLDMMRWMRRHNEDPGTAPKVSFYGFDMQHSRVAMLRVEEFLRGQDEAAADSVAVLYRCFRQYTDRPATPIPNYGAAPAEQREICRTGVRAAHSLVADARDRLAAADPNGYELALRAARVVEQNEESRAPGGRSRDDFMAENSLWLLERPGAEGRVVLWAHNAHVSAAAGWQGDYLRRALGADYVVVGFTFHSGGFNAVELGVGLRAKTVPPPPADSYEREFHGLGHPIFAVDSRPLRTGAPAGAAWLRGPRSYWMIGAVFDDRQPYQWRWLGGLPDHYDLIIHIDRTAPSQLRPFRYQ